MKQPRNHHHVPQFYFKPWANNRDKLWAFDRSNQRVIGVTIRDIASQRDFYGRTEAEAVLQPYEDHCKDVIENTLRGIDRIIPTNWDLDAYRPISAEYIEVLISLANFQYSRSLRTRLLIRETASRIISDKAKKSGIADPRFEDPETLSKQISKNWLAWQHVDLLSQHTKYLPCFRNKIFIVGVNSTGIKLVTSDNPLVKIGPDINAPANSLGLSSPGVRLSLPLSPWVVISMFDPIRFSALSEWHGQPKPLPESEVSLLNRAQLKQCVRHVYSADHNFSWTSDGEELTTK